MDLLDREGGGGAFLFPTARSRGCLLPSGPRPRSSLRPREVGLVPPFLKTFVTTSTQFSFYEGDLFFSASREPAPLFFSFHSS